MKRLNVANVWVTAVLLASLLLPVGSVRAQGLEGTIIAILATVPDDKPTEPAIAMMKELMAHIAKQPGFIDQGLLASSFPGGKPSHVHLSRWRSLSDWEAVHASHEFLSMLERTAPYFEFKAAEVFKPVP